LGIGEQYVQGRERAVIIAEAVGADDVDSLDVVWVRLTGVAHNVAVHDRTGVGSGESDEVGRQKRGCAPTPPTIGSAESQEGEEVGVRPDEVDEVGVGLCVERRHLEIALSRSRGGELRERKRGCLLVAAFCAIRGDGPSGGGWVAAARRHRLGARAALVRWGGPGL
jgi:hypothetical protein